MSNNIVKSKTFDASLISYDEPKTNSKGGKSIKVLYNGRAFKVQTPIMQTWGVTKRLDSDGETVKGFDMSMRFDPSERNSHKKFKKMCMDIQTKLIDDAFENSQKWFGKKAKLRDVVEDKFNTLLKYPRKKDNSGELDLSREPTLRPKFRFWDGAFTGSKLFKLAGRATKPEPLHEYSAEELGDYIEELVPMHSEVCLIVTFQKLWFVGSNFGITVVIDEAHVKPAVEYSKQSSISYDSDDDEELERVSRMAEKNTNYGDDDDDDDDEDESNLGGGGTVQEDEEEDKEDEEDNDDEEDKEDEGEDKEDEEEAEPEEVVVETPKPKKKRVVRRRKKKE